MNERRLLYIGLSCMVLVACITLFFALLLGSIGIKDNFNTQVPVPSMVVNE